MKMKVKKYSIIICKYGTKIFLYKKMPSSFTITNINTKKKQIIALIMNLIIIL